MTEHEITPHRLTEVVTKISLLKETFLPSEIKDSTPSHERNLIAHERKLYRLIAEVPSEIHLDSVFLEIPLIGSRGIKESVVDVLSFLRKRSDLTNDFLVFVEFTKNLPSLLLRTSDLVQIVPLASRSCRPLDLAVAIRELRDIGLFHSETRGRYALTQMGLEVYKALTENGDNKPINPRTRLTARSGLS